jgi:uncharacterized protein
MGFFWQPNSQNGNLLKMTQKTFFIETELFEIPCNGDSIIYAPLKKAVLLSDKKMVNFLCDVQEGVPVELQSNKRTINRLKRLGILKDKPFPEEKENGTKKDYDQPFLPTTLTLFLTSDCNLACRYCYGGGGDKKVDMPIDIALDAIDLLFLNASKTGSKQVHLGFHGGGEQVLRLPTMKMLVDYARKLSDSSAIGLGLGLTTNAVMSRSAAEWIALNIQELNVSFDGPEDIQNHQRPMKNGGDSFKGITNTLKLWKAKGTRFSTRSTITRFSQERIPEIVDYISEHFSPQIIHLEPMFVSARAAQSDMASPDEDAFVKGFLKAEKIAQNRRFELHFSGKKFPNVSSAFCGLGWKNFAVTPEGNVTSCFEVMSEADARAGTFFYGKYVHGKGFSFEQEKIKNLRRLSGKVFSFCENCFAKYHCAGDCRAKGLYSHNEMTYQGAGRCGIIREIVRTKLIEELGINHLV